MFKNKALLVLGLSLFSQVKATKELDFCPDDVNEQVEAEQEQTCWLSGTNAKRAAIGAVAFAGIVVTILLAKRYGCCNLDCSRFRSRS